jgi:hypothetical protein
MKLLTKTNVLIMQMAVIYLNQFQQRAAQVTGSMVSIDNFFSTS